MSSDHVTPKYVPGDLVRLNQTALAVSRNLVIGMYAIVIGVERRNSEALCHDRSDVGISPSEMVARVLPYVYYVLCSSGIEGPLEHYHVSPLL